ncbi:MAG: hypothetical protein HND47_16840 [Chloroflexi bacterium]|nr:hypothetical protein [Chloroflexota bacterium]
MGKYQSSVVKRGREKKREVHYAWRGIGCLMMLIMPAISIVAGVGTIDYGLENNWAIPYQLLGYPRLPDFFYRSSGLVSMFSPITGINNFYAYAAMSFIYMVLLSGIISVVYAFIYGLMTPSRYGPLDVPPPNVKVKRYKR